MMRTTGGSSDVSGAILFSFLILLLLGWVSGTYAAVPSVVINEVLYDAPGEDTGHEWVELYNTGDIEADLGGWRVERAGTQFALATVIPSGTALAPRAFFLIGETAVPNADLVATLVFQNGGSATDGVRLVAGDGQVVDVLLYDTPNTSGLPDETGNPGTSFAPDVADGHSLARVSDGADTNASGADFQDTVVSTPRAANSGGSAAAPTSFPSPAASAASAPNGIVVNEVLPNPIGEDAAGEFIELYNTTSSVIDLGGALLDDAEGGSAAYTLAPGTTITGGGYLTFTQKQTGIVLNNDGDTARLLAAEGAVVSSLTYPKVPREGVAWMRSSNGSPTWTATPTAGAVNVLTPLATNGKDDDQSDPAAGATPRTVSGATVSPAPRSTAVVSLARARELSLGATLEVVGAVTVPPGVFGADIFYISDSNSGIQVSVRSGSPPALVIGDRVSVRGTKSSVNNEARILATDVQKLSTGPVPQARDYTAEEISEGLEGMLVRIRGALVRVSKDSFTVADSSGNVRVLIKASVGWERPSLTRGQTVRVTGVVSQYGEGYRLLPRFTSDLLLEGQVEGTSAERTALAGSAHPETVQRRERRRSAPERVAPEETEEQRTTPAPSPTGAPPNNVLDLRHVSFRNLSWPTLLLWGTAAVLGVVRVFARRMF